MFSFLNLNAQTYDKKITVNNLGEFNLSMSTVNSNKINISSYVTKQNILSYANYDKIQKTVTDLPKFRYELILISNSTYEKKVTKTWIYGARVFINNTEITHQQFPDGFTALIETKPTTIYWYETSDTKINIKITWASSNYFRDNK
jgi:hypothetical protein